ncbi:hypothetical protein BJX64DRAFT_245300 [Aspergillus heterothallicus]
MPTYYGWDDLDLQGEKNDARSLNVEPSGSDIDPDPQEPRYYHVRPRGNTRSNTRSPFSYDRTDRRFRSNTTKAFNNRIDAPTRNTVVDISEDEYEDELVTVGNTGYDVYDEWSYLPYPRRPSPRPRPLSTGRRRVHHSPETRVRHREPQYAYPRPSQYESMRGNPRKGRQFEDPRDVLKAEGLREESVVAMTRIDNEVVRGTENLQDMLDRLGGWMAALPAGDEPDEFRSKVQNDLRYLIHEVKGQAVKGTSLEGKLFEAGDTSASHGGNKDSVYAPPQISIRTSSRTKKIGSLLDQEPDERS